jgi:hypothetical protein
VAPGIQTLHYTKNQAAVNQRPPWRNEKIIELRARLSANGEDVLEALRHDKSDASAFSFEHCISGHS